MPSLFIGVLLKVIGMVSIGWLGLALWRDAKQTRERMWRHDASDQESLPAAETREESSPKPLEKLSQ